VGLGMPRSPTDRARLPSPFVRFLLQRAALVPAQILFVLLVLYLAIDEPANIAAGQDLGIAGFVQGFSQMVVNDFTGNWGPSTFAQYQGIPLSQLYAWMLPQSVELAVFALGISAAIAYPVSLWSGWTRRAGVDSAVQATSLVGTLVPVMLVGLPVITVLFFGFIAVFHDLPTQGVTPTVDWWFYTNGGTFPPWIIDTRFTQPTGFPLVDGAIHGAWGFELVTLVKTLLQASVIALVYVTIFLRHGRSVVRAASRELHLTAARSRGIRERTLLWKHTGRRVRPTFLLVFALTLPAYLGTQFVVEATFVDPGIGFLSLTALTGFGTGAYGLEMLEVMMFLLTLIVILWLFVLDIVARRWDPREVVRP
jgi:ABC-type dipeptide/oligopeptide/nickel transport system permease component